MIRFVAETGSTNADLLALGADWPEGDWLVARRQSAGRGRAGRAWEDGAGNFMGSTAVQLRPGDPPPQTLALVAGLAAWEAVRAVAEATELMLKWPNDLLIGQAKLAGILLERAGDTVVIGMGVNLARAPDLPDRATAALPGHGVEVSPDDFAERLADRFAAHLAAWRAGDWPRQRDLWLARAHPEGAAIEVKDSSGAAISGTFAGLGVDGAALLRLADGTTRPIHAGDVELVGGA